MRTGRELWKHVSFVVDRIVETEIIDDRHGKLGQSGQIHRLV